MLNDERIPNLVSEFKSNNIWTLLAEKQSKIGKIPELANFQQFFGHESQMLFDLNFDTKFGILSSFNIF